MTASVGPVEPLEQAEEGRGLGFMRWTIAALLSMALSGAPATASPPDACELLRIDYVRSPTVYILFRQNLGERGAIVPPMYHALVAWIDGNPAETQRLLEEAAAWPVNEGNVRASHAARLPLELMRGYDPDGVYTLPPRRTSVG